MITSRIIKHLVFFLFLFFFFFLLYTYLDNGIIDINLKCVIVAAISASGPIIISSIMEFNSRRKKEAMNQNEY